MNKERRRQLQEITSELGEIINDIEVIKGRLDDTKCDIENVCEEEDESYNNLPESFQDGERGERMQEAISFMESSCDEIDNSLNSIEEVVGIIEEAITGLNDAINV